MPDASSRAGDESEDAIAPVYPVDKLAAVPLAARYCHALRELPRQRREACCPGTSQFAPTAECTRTLSSALRSGAVTLSSSDLDRCVAAVKSETASCDWVTSVGGATVAPCRGILRGMRDQGQGCRSSLECKEGLRCRGLGAVQAGRCAPPLAALGICNIGVDSLAAFTGQDDFDRHHPECAGYCVARHCVNPIPL